MSEEYERDRVVGTALRELPVPEHRPEFFSELAALLKEEWRVLPDLQPKRPLRRLIFRRPALAGAVALALIATVLVVTSLPRRQSVFAVVEDAHDRFADVPPFRATILAPPDRSSRFQLSYRDKNGWRFEVLELGQHPQAAGSYTVWDGTQQITYTREGNVYETGRPVGGNMLGFFIWQSEGGIEDWRERCTGSPAEVLPEETVASRLSSHVRCAFDELWVDKETGLILKIHSLAKPPEGIPAPTPEPIGYGPGATIEITEIEYNPAFPEGAFEFVPPPGAREALPEPEREPVGKLKVGEPAPSWSGDLLSGGSFRLASLRGKPAAVLFWAPWCEPCIGDPLSQFEMAYRKHANTLGLVSVSYDKREATQEIVNQKGLAFPVVVDEPGKTLRRWGLSGIPTLVLLDAKGRVMSSYLGPLTNEDFERLIDALAQGRPLPAVSPRK